MKVRFLILVLGLSLTGLIFAEKVEKAENEYFDILLNNIKDSFIDELKSNTSEESYKKLEPSIKKAFNSNKLYKLINDMSKKYENLTKELQEKFLKFIKEEIDFSKTVSKV